MLKFFITTSLFLGLGGLAYIVVRRATESKFEKNKCQERSIILAAERKRLIEYIIYFLLPIWIFYEVYISCWVDINWGGDVFSNFFTAVFVLFLQEMKQLDNKDCGQWWYALVGILLLIGWMVINGSEIGNSSNAVTTAYRSYGVPMGVGLIIWVGHERLKYCLGIGNCYVRRLKCLFRRSKRNYYRRMLK